MEAETTAKLNAEPKVEDGLKKQMTEMSIGFEDIVKAREEAKKKLQEQFEGVYQKIQENKDDGEKKSEYMHQMLENFRQEFNNNLNELFTNLSESIEAESKMFMLQEMEL